MDKENVVYIYNRILFSLKRKEILKHANNITWMNPEDIIQSEIGQIRRKGQLLYFNYTRYLEELNSYK